MRVCVYVCVVCTWVTKPYYTESCNRESTQTSRPRGSPGFQTSEQANHAAKLTSKVIYPNKPLARPQYTSSVPFA